MKAFIVRTLYYAAICMAAAHASPTPMESTKPQGTVHNGKLKISQKKSADYVGAFLRVTQPEISEWIAAYSKPLKAYLQYSQEVRETTAKLSAEPYIDLLRTYSTEYQRQTYPDNPFQFVPWQDFIDEDLLTALQQPWEYKWRLPTVFALSPENRIKGLRSELLEVYPRSEIENEEAFLQRPLLLSDKISTVEYLAEFSLPFGSTTSLTDWLFAPVTLPVAVLGNEPQDALYIELDRRDRIEYSLQAIYTQLGTIIEGIKGYDLQNQLTGKLPLPPDTAQTLAYTIGTTIEAWERIQDLVGTMASVMKVLKEEPNDD